MSFAVFWTSAAGMFGSNTKTFGPKRVELALETGSPRATSGRSAHKAAAAARTDTVGRFFQPPFAVRNCSFSVVGTGPIMRGPPGERCEGRWTHRGPPLRARGHQAHVTNRRGHPGAATA